MNSLILKIFCY